MSLACSFFDISVLLLLFKVDAIDHALGRVLKDNELVGNDTINNLLLLCLCGVVDMTGLMELCLATTFALVSLQNLIDIRGLIAARVFVLRTEGSRRHFDFRRLLVVPALAHLSNRVILHATVTFYEMEVGPDFPVDLLP